jgi:hypothetical protein
MKRAGWAERSEARHFRGDAMTLGLAALNPTYDDVAKFSRVLKVPQ